MEHAGIDAISNDDFKCYLLLWNDSLRDLALIHPSTFFLDIVNVSNTSGVPAFTPSSVSLIKPMGKYATFEANS